MEITQGVQSELDRIQKKLDNKEVNPSDLNEDQYRNHAYDNHDYNTLDELYKEFLENENLPYNALRTGP